MLSNRTIKTIVETIEKHKNVLLGYLFGSSIKENTYTDIDLGIFLSTCPSLYDASKFAMRLGRTLEKALNYQREFDIKILNLAPPHFQFNVIAKGILIFSRSEKTRLSYEEEVISTFQDYRDTLDWFNTLILERD